MTRPSTLNPKISKRPFIPSNPAQWPSGKGSTYGCFHNIEYISDRNPEDDESILREDSIYATQASATTTKTRKKSSEQNSGMGGYENRFNPSESYGGAAQPLNTTTTSGNRSKSEPRKRKAMNVTNRSAQLIGGDGQPQNMGVAMGVSVGLAMAMSTANNNSGILSGRREMLEKREKAASVEGLGNTQEAQISMSTGRERERERAAMTMALMKKGIAPPGVGVSAAAMESIINSAQQKGSQTADDFRIDFNIDYNQQQQQENTQNTTTQGDTQTFGMSLAKMRMLKKKESAFKPFVPSSPPKVGYNCTIDKFPTYTVGAVPDNKAFAFRASEGPEPETIFKYSGISTKTIPSPAINFIYNQFHPDTVHATSSK
ncbi:MAG: hypothetical protein EZS28_032192 [Streblomastix strix]|uniref:Uncharacterized protein n=1 Tax=Streblomastix strix TaxID=222440 RepID=A0A5J4UQH1_9EUKA|nr:MAG: hypothetical protein EZS28_032192 [Streblomastix strix]